MKFGLYLFILRFSLVSIALAQQAELIGNTCASAIRNITFDCEPSSDCRCSYSPVRQTIIFCVQSNMRNQSDIGTALETVFGQCTDLAPSALQQDRASASRNVRRVSSAYLRNRIINFPIMLPQENLNYAKFCVDTALTSAPITQNYVGGILGYWAVVMFLKIVAHVLRSTAPRMIFAFDNTLSRKIKEHALMPATFRYSHSSQKKFLGYTFAIPTRLQTFIILGYAIINIVLLFANYPYIENSWFYASNADQIRTFLAWRSGIFAFAHVPLLFLFAGRNNFLIWLTGWPLDTFNVFHRWIGRGMLANAIIHAIVHSVQFILRGIMTARWKAKFVQFGFTTVLAAGLMIVFATHFLRSRWYETFLVIHIILAIVFTIGANYHASYLGGSQEYICAAIVVWAFDRVVRIIRILWNGVNSKCDAELFADGVIKMKISYSGRWKIKPGQYAFIQILQSRYFWQSHPFTITSSCVPKDEGKLILLIKSKEGFTGQLRKELEKSFSRRKLLPVLIDGPYGITHPVDRYDNILLIAGGIGVTGVYSYANVLRSQESDKRIIFVWCIADDTPLQWFECELEYMAIDPRFDVRVHMKTDNKELTSKQSGSITPSTLKPSLIQYFSDRFPAITVLEDEIAHATRSTAVVCCGPGKMNDDVRYSISRNLANAKARVDYFEESFSW